MEANPELTEAIRNEFGGRFEVEDLRRVVRVEASEQGGRPLAEIDPDDLSVWTSLKVDFSVDDLETPEATRQEAVEALEALAEPFVQRGFERDGEPELSMPMDGRNADNWSPDVKQVLVHEADDVATIAELVDFAARQRRSATLDGE